jgi:hypothetical protein
MKLTAYIERHKGQYLREENGSLHLIVGGLRIPLSFDRNNYHLARLMLTACGVTSLSMGAQAAIQRLQVTAHDKASSITLKRFSALSTDYERLYIPVRGGDLLRITRSGISIVKNGQNEDKVWVEHPYNAPFHYQSSAGNDGLEHFERLVVNTQACRIPAMRWLVAMHEGFFLYVRDLSRARFLLVHVGGTQQGKTSGAQRYTLLQVVSFDSLAHRRLPHNDRNFNTRLDSLAASIAAHGAH